MLEKLPEALGEALEGVRAGLDQTLFHAVDLRQGMAALKLTSLAFADHAPMPEKYSADGPGVSPPLAWTGVPAAATEVVLIVEDADSPTPQPLVHAIAVGLPARAVAAAVDGTGAVAEALRSAADHGDGALAEHGDGALAEAAMSAVGDAEPLVTMGLNSLLREQWLPPDPPPGHGVHRYLFQVFALGPVEGEADPLPESPGRDALRSAVQRRGLASGCLTGTYERPSTRITEPNAQPAFEGLTPIAPAMAQGAT